MRALHAAVLATRRVPGLASLYGGAYRGGAAACAAVLARLPGVSCVALHRGLASGAAVPGVSDVDLVVVRGPLDPGREAGWLARMTARRSALRAVFPALGDLWVGTPRELELYLRWGGLRAREDRPSWRALSGVLPAAPDYRASPLKRTALEPWSWALTSYMDLSRRVWLPGRDLAAKRDADLRKMSRETERLCAAVLDGRAPAPRSAVPEPDGAPKDLWAGALARLDAAARRALERASPGAALAAPFAVTPADGEWTLRQPPYHTVTVVPDASDRARLERAAARPGPGVPLVLTPACWELFLQSSYLGAPLGRLGPRAVPPPPQGVFAAWRPEASGPAPSARLLAPRLARETAAEAASWMLLWWRALWADPAHPNRFVLWHLYTRGLGLRLALAGRPAPFDEWDALLDAARGLDGEGPLAAALTRWSAEEPSECLDAPSRAALAPEHCAAVAGLMGRLAGDLEPL